MRHIHCVKFLGIPNVLSMRLFFCILQSGKSFQDCLSEVVKNCSKCLSDIEAYRRAVKFYFSTATVSFRMTIDLSGDNGAAPAITMTESKTLNVSLDDLLDF